MAEEPQLEEPVAKIVETPVAALIEEKFKCKEVGCAKGHIEYSAHGLSVHMSRWHNIRGANWEAQQKTRAKKKAAKALAMQQGSQENAPVADSTSSPVSSKKNDAVAKIEAEFAPSSVCRYCPHCGGDMITGMELTIISIEKAAVNSGITRTIGPRGTLKFCPCCRVNLVDTYAYCIGILKEQ